MIESAAGGRALELARLGLAVLEDLLQRRPDHPLGEVARIVDLWERLVEEAADATGIDSITLRRRNFLSKTAFPLRTLTGSTYDSGDPDRLLTIGLQAADWDGFEARRREAKRKGKLRGLGVALFLEPSGGMGKEQVEIRVAPDGHLQIYSLAGPSGQGHETAFPLLVANILGLPEENIELRYNDDAAPKLIGVGSFGSRSLISHGSAFATATERPQKSSNAWSFSASPTPITSSRGIPSAFRARFNPVALLMPEGKIITLPLLKTT